MFLISLKNALRATSMHLKNAVLLLFLSFSQSSSVVINIEEKSSSDESNENDVLADLESKIDKILKWTENNSGQITYQGEVLALNIFKCIKISVIIYTYIIFTIKSALTDVTAIPYYIVYMQIGIAAIFFFLIKYYELMYAVADCFESNIFYFSFFFAESYLIK